jgi:hypothetical protein
MGDLPSGTPHQSDFERGRTTARSMSDRELLDLHAQGAAAFRAGAWDVLDAEVSRRQRVRDRQTAEPHVEEERYPALRITVILVKVSSAVVLIATVAIAILYLGTNALAALLIVVVGVLAAVSYWAGAELLLVLMDIEANTRFLRRNQQ